MHSLDWQKDTPKGSNGLQFGEAVIPRVDSKIDCYKMRMTSRLKIESSILEHLRQPNLKINALTRLEIGYFERSKWVAIRR
jgi:hypothetical protein